MDTLEKAVEKHMTDMMNRRKLLMKAQSDLDDVNKTAMAQSKQNNGKITKSLSSVVKNRTAVRDRAKMKFDEVNTPILEKAKKRSK